MTRRFLEKEGGVSRFPGRFSNHDLNLATGDLNGDGYDEIIYLLPAPNTDGTPRATLRVMSLINPSPAVDWRNPSSWRINDYTIGIGFGGIDTADAAHRRTQSLAVGDLNGDGKDDIAVVGSWLIADFNDSTKSKAMAELNIFYGNTFSATGFTAPGGHEFYNYDSANPAVASLFGASGLMQLPTETSIWMNPTSINNYIATTGYSSTYNCLSSKLLPMQLGLDIVDAGGGSKKELLLGYDYFIAASMRVGSATSTTCSPTAGYQVEPLHYKDGKIAKVGSSLPSLQMSTLSILNTNNYFGDMPSLNEATYYSPIMTSSVQSLMRDSSMRIGTMPISVTAARMQTGQETPSIIAGINQHELVNGAYALKKGSTYSNAPTAANAIVLPHPLQYGEVRVADVRPATMSSVENGNTQLHFGFVVQYDFRDGTVWRTHTEFVSGNNTALPQFDKANGGGFYRARRTFTRGASFCLPDSDKDSPRFTYKGYDYLYTDPTVVAAVAAPPYVKDIAEIDPLYLSDFGTAFSTYAGTGHGRIDGSGSHLGAYVSTEAALGAGPAKFIVEFEAEYNHNWNEETEKLVEQTEEIAFTASDEDVVVVLTYPMDVYAYVMEYPTDAAGTQTAVADYIMHVPYAPVYNIVSLEDYDEAYQRFPDALPDIAGEVFTHEPGYPSTYTYKKEKYADSWISGGSANYATTGTSSITYSIDKSQSTATTTSNTVDFKVGAGGKYGGTFVEGQVTAGVSFGFEWTGGGIVTETNGTSYSGTVNGSNYHRYAPYSGASWRLLQYNYYGAQNFPVVTYQVTMNRDNNASPYLPEAYGIDNDRSTDTALGIYWTPSRDDMQPGDGSTLHYSIYRKKYGDSAVPAEVGHSAYSYDPLTGRYLLLDSGLTVGTSYEYYISCSFKGNTGATDVIQTPTFIGITNPDTAHPYTFTVQPPESLVIRPGVTATVSAEFANGALPAGGAEGVTYAWKKYARGLSGDKSWTNPSTAGGSLAGLDSDTLSFTAPGPGQEGRYLLVATYKNKSYFSNEVVVSYRLNETAVSLAVSPSTLPASATELKATATVTAADGGAVPDGTTMRFAFTLPDGGTVLKSALVSGGTASVTLLTDTAGQYSVSASYLGNVAYASSQSDTVYRSKGGGTRRTLSHSLTQAQYYYGDTFPVRVSVYPADGSAPVQGVTIVEVYKYNNGVLSSTRESGWIRETPVEGDPDFEPTLTIKGVGKYRLKITANHVTDADPLYFDITVKPRPVGYTIKNLTVYTAETGTAGIPDLLSITRTSGSLVDGDGTDYTAADLVVSDALRAPVTDFTDLAAGTYYIRVAENKIKSDPRYSITTNTGVLIVNDMPSGDLASVTFDAGTLGSVRALSPASLTSGGLVAKNSAVTLEATPEKSHYQFNGWAFSPEQPLENLTERGSRVTIKAVGGSLNVTALYEVPAIDVSPANAKIDRGGQQAFRATLPARLSGGVDWHVDGKTSAGTSIDENGVLSVSETEGAKLLTVTATSRVDGAVLGSVEAAVNQPALYLVVRDAEDNECTDLTLAKGEVRTFTVLPVPVDRQLDKLEVTTAKGTVASVQPQPEGGDPGSFTVKGEAAGTTTLTLKLYAGEDSVSLPFTVRVLASAADTVDAALTPEAALAVGGTRKLVPAYTPAKAPIASVEWASANETIATVDSAGKVTAVGPGRVSITLTARPLNGPAITKECAVTVTAPAKAVKITDAAGQALPKTITLAAMGDNTSPVFDTGLRLEAVCTPLNSTDPVQWSSNKEDVATVDPDTGEVRTAGKAGTVTITAQAGGKKATCKITVVMTVPNNGVTLSDAALSLAAKGSKTLVAQVADRATGERTTNKKVVWTSDDTSIATVSSKGKVTGQRDGTTTIRATSAENPAIYAVCNVTVTAPITAMAFNQKAFTIGTGETTSLGLTFNGGKAVTGLGGVTLTSSNPNVLAFTGAGAESAGASYTLSDANETVTLEAAAGLPGTSTTETVVITAMTTRAGDNKVFQVPLRIKVTSNATVQADSVALTAASKKKTPGTGGSLAGSPNAPLAVGASFTPAVTVKPSSASNKNVAWTLRAEHMGEPTDPLAYVDFDPSSGRVTAKRACGTDVVLFLEGTGHGAGAAGVNIPFQTAVRVNKLTLQVAPGASTALEPGNQIQVLATINPDIASHTSLQWSSSNKDVVVIESAEQGQSVTVKALKAGTVALKAVTLDGSRKSASIKLTVRQPVKDIVITTEPADASGGMGTISVTQGQTLKLKAGLNVGTRVDGTPEGIAVVNDNPAPTSKGVTWRLVSGEGIVSLNTKTGAVKGLAYGTAVIEAVPAGAVAGSYSTRATIHDMEAGGAPVAITYRNTIWVSVYAPAKSVKIDQANFSVYCGGPDDADRPSLTLTTTLNPVMDSLSPEERALVWSIPKDTGLDFDMDHPAMMAGGEAGVSADNKNLTYTTYGDMGEVMLKVNPVAAKTAPKVTVTTKKSSKKATVTITVTPDPAKAPAVSGVSLKQSAMWLKTGGTVKLAPSITPKKPGNTNLSWTIEEYTVTGDRVDSSAAGSVAVVNASGKVTAKGTGYAMVTVTSMDGRHKATCTIYCVARN